jgi:hypothetical protein
MAVGPAGMLSDGTMTPGDVFWITLYWVWWFAHRHYLYQPMSNGAVQLMRVKRHGRTMGASGFFWCLAGYRSMRRGSLEPIIHHAEWRAAWRLAREI